MSWDDARKECKKAGTKELKDGLGYVSTKNAKIDDMAVYTYACDSKLCVCSRFSLVVIENAAENSYVKDRMGADKWIGITDKDQEGNYVTVHGSTVPWKLYATGEPNNCCGGIF